MRVMGQSPPGAGGPVSSGSGPEAVCEQRIAFRGAQFAPTKLQHKRSFFLACIGCLGAYVYKVRMVEKVKGTLLVNYFVC